jgi:aminoglycoside phosphotransferase (APT) family kinase protein
MPLISQDEEVRVAIKQLGEKIDAKRITAIWDLCLQAKEWGREPVWTHGDLLPGNLLVQEGRISAIIDFGLFGIGDPACDLIAAWSILTRETRPIFREALKADEATWMRGCGWALSVGLIILPYYEKTNPGLVAVGKRLIQEVLTDFST